MFGNIAFVAKGQGLNIILNLFFGTVVNAAYGLTLQVQTAVGLFVKNFQKAVNPQIIKSYSKGDIGRTHQLITISSKFSFFLMLIITTPILFNADFVLALWLKEPPFYTASFVQLSLLAVLIDSLSGPIMTGAQATGEIKWYQIIVGSLLFLNLPISYALIYFGLDATYVFVVNLIISILSFNFRVVFLKNIMGFDLISFYSKVISRVFIISILCAGMYYYKVNNFHTEDFIGFFIQTLTLLLIVFVMIYFIGVDRKEKIYMKNYLFKLIKK